MPQDDTDWEMLSLEEASHLLSCVPTLPSPENYVCILQKCRRQKNLVYAKQVHAHVRKNGLETIRAIGNHIVPMFVACESLSDAREVFDRLAFRNVHAWTSLISGYIQCGLTGDALDVYQRMLDDNVHPSSHTLATLLKSCTDLEDLRNIHLKIAEQGFERHLVVGSALVNLYAKFGSLSEAKEAFDKLPVRNVVSWTSLIAGYMEQGLGKEALKTYELMQLQGFSPNGVTYISILRACATIPFIERGQEVHMDIVKKGLYGDIFIGSSLVDMYAKCGSLSEAQHVLNKLPVRDVVSWNALISGYAEHGPAQEALNCFEQMQKEGILQDAITLVCALKACGNMGAIDQGLELHTEVLKKKYDNDHFIGNTLVDMYAKCGCLMEALKGFERLPVQDVTSFNSMIKGFGTHHDGDMAVRLFERMQQKGVKPDSITFTCLLSACSHANLVQQGRKVFKTMTTKYDITPTVDHFTCLVELFARSGHLCEAEKFLESIPGSPCKDMWIALLTACKATMELDLGLRCFQRLVQIDPECSTPYMLMENIYACGGRRNDVSRIEEMRRQVGANKKPASAVIEVGHKVHEFIVGSEHSKEISRLLGVLNPRMRKGGSVPNVDLVSRSFLSHMFDEA